MKLNLQQIQDITSNGLTTGLNQHLDSIYSSKLSKSEAYDVNKTIISYGHGVVSSSPEPDYSLFTVPLEVEPADEMYFLVSANDGLISGEGGIEHYIEDDTWYAYLSNSSVGVLEGIYEPDSEYGHLVFSVYNPVGASYKTEIDFGLLYTIDEGTKISPEFKEAVRQSRPDILNPPTDSTSVLMTYEDDEGCLPHWFNLYESEGHLKVHRAFGLPYYTWLEKNNGEYVLQSGWYGQYLPDMTWEDFEDIISKNYLFVSCSSNGSDFGIFPWTWINPMWTDWSSGQKKYIVDGIQCVVADTITANGFIDTCHTEIKRLIIERSQSGGVHIDFIKIS